MMRTQEKIDNAQAVNALASRLNDELDRCDNGEGTACASLDASLEHYASRCCELVEQIRFWGRDVFGGRVPHDQGVEDAWLQAATALNNRCVEMLERSKAVESECYDLPGANRLGASLLVLQQLTYGWVSPRMAVGPSARQLPVFPVKLDEVRHNLVTLKPLPGKWLPSDPRQRGVYRKVGGS